MSDQQIHNNTMYTQQATVMPVQNLYMLKNVTKDKFIPDGGSSSNCGTAVSYGGGVSTEAFNAGKTKPMVKDEAFVIP